MMKINNLRIAAHDVIQHYKIFPANTMLHVTYMLVVIFPTQQCNCYIMCVIYQI